MLKDKIKDPEAHTDNPCVKSEISQTKEYTFFPHSVAPMNPLLPRAFIQVVNLPTYVC